MKTRFLLILISVFNFQILFAQKVACIGNSITYGAGLPNRTVNCYPAQLDKMLGGNYDVRNYGVGGRVMLKTGDYPYWAEPEYAAALAFEPDIVIIMLGTNDSKPWNWTPSNSLLFETDYVDFINSFRSLASKPKIIISYPCKAYNSAFGISDSVIFNAICPIVKKISFDMGTTLVDMYTATSGISNLFPDGIHPNIEGTTTIAKKFYSIITSPKPVITQNGNIFVASESNSYQWYKNYLPLSNEDGSTFNTGGKGAYSVAVSISNANDDILHSTVTKVEPRVSISSLTLYPNPASVQLHYKYQVPNNSLGSIEIINVLGKTVIENEVELNTNFDYYSINISNLLQGHYILKLHVGGETIISRFIKN